MLAKHHNDVKKIMQKNMQTDNSSSQLCNIMTRRDKTISCLIDFRTSHNSWIMGLKPRLFV